MNDIITFNTESGVYTPPTRSNSSDPWHHLPAAEWVQKQMHQSLAHFPNQRHANEARTDIGQLPVHGHMRKRFWLIAIDQRCGNQQWPLHIPLKEETFNFVNYIVNCPIAGIDYN